MHATLVHASLKAYGRFVRPLSADEQEEYYDQMALVAQIFGTPAAAIPPTLDAFRDDFRARLGNLCVTEPAREVARVILEAPLPAPLRLLAPSHRLATAGLLPERLRDEYGLRWSPVHALVLPVAARSLHLGAVPLLRLASRLSPPQALAA